MAAQDRPHGTVVGARSAALALLARALFVCSAIVVAVRITQGVDLSDEAYYAIFVHDWLREPIREAHFLTLHQTSALLLFPCVYLYRALVGSTDGLMLFLRCLYLASSIACGLFVVRFLQEAGVGLLRWLCGAIVVAFVPYNLPAPSYNTVALQAMLVGCACLGCAVLRAEARQPTVRLVVLGAAAWTVATVAYPSVLVPLVVLLVGIVILVRPTRALTMTILLWVGAGQLVGGLAVLGLLGWSRLVRCAELQAAVSSTFDLDTSAIRAADLFRENRLFGLVVALALVLGLVRRWLPAVLASLVELALLVAPLFVPPALFRYSHAALMTVALGGVSLLGGLRRSATARARLFALLYLVSWIAGFAMAGTASFGAFKIPMGALLASILAMAVAGERVLASPRLRFLSAAGLVPLGIAIASLWIVYYGETPLGRPTTRTWVRHGPYAGLAATMEDARLLEIARQALREHERPGDTLTVTGRMPGLYLLANAPVRALIPYTLTGDIPPSGRRVIHDYYAVPANRPSLVLAYRDPYLPYIDPFAPDFASWYALQGSYAVPFGTLEVYRRRSSALPVRVDGEDERVVRGIELEEPGRAHPGPRKGLPDQRRHGLAAGQGDRPVAAHVPVGPQRQQRPEVARLEILDEQGGGLAAQDGAQIGEELRPPLGRHVVDDVSHDHQVGHVVHDRGVVSQAGRRQKLDALAQLGLEEGTHARAHVEHGDA